MDKEENVLRALKEAGWKTQPFRNPYVDSEERDIHIARELIRDANTDRDSAYSEKTIERIRDKLKNDVLFASKAISSDRFSIPVEISEKDLIPEKKNIFSKIADKIKTALCTHRENPRNNEPFC